MGMNDDWSQNWMTILPTSQRETWTNLDEGRHAWAFLLLQGYFLLTSRFEYWINGAVLDSWIHFDSLRQLGVIQLGKFKSVWRKSFEGSSEISGPWKCLRPIDDSSWEVLCRLRTIRYICIFDGTLFWKNSLPLDKCSL